VNKRQRIDNSPRKNWEPVLCGLQKGVSLAQFTKCANLVADTPALHKHSQLLCEHLSKQSSYWWTNEELLKIRFVPPRRFENGAFVEEKKLECIGNLYHPSCVDLVYTQVESLHIC